MRRQSQRAGRYRPVALTVGVTLLAIASSSCSSQQASLNETGSCGGGFGGCDGDTAVGRDATDGAADSTTDGGSSDGTDLGVDAGASLCTCADPADTCMTSPGPFAGACLSEPLPGMQDMSEAVPLCVRAGVCNALNACPTGYSCTFLGPPSDSRGCVCTDNSICGVPCGSGGACPCALVCGASNKCVPCSFSSDCPAGQICQGGGRCGPPLPPGPGPDGVSCQTPADCQGVCVANVCRLLRARSNGYYPARPLIPRRVARQRCGGGLRLIHAG
jgi:hypothetical protein